VLAVSLIDDLDAVLGDFEIFKKLLHLSFPSLIGESATTEDALLLGVETLFEEGVDWVVGLAGLEEVALAGVEYFDVAVADAAEVETLDLEIVGLGVDLHETVAGELAVLVVFKHKIILVVADGVEKLLDLPLLNVVGESSETEVVGLVVGGLVRRREEVVHHRLRQLLPF
jgi:hypothetical protein